MVSDHILVLSTAPNIDIANSLAQLIIEYKCAACVNIIPNISSVYRWEQNIENSSEVLMLIKTIKSLLPNLKQLIDKNHPYQVPELISFNINDGSKQYLDWINECLK